MGVRSGLRLRWVVWKTVAVRPIARSAW